MYLRILIFNLISIICVNSELRDIEEMYLNFFVQIESVKKSVDTLKLRVDVLSEKNLSSNCASMDNNFSQVFQNFGYILKSLDDLNTRLDKSSQNDKSSHQEVKYNMEQYEFQQNASLKEISEIKRNYSLLVDELTVVKNSEERLKQRHEDLEAKYLKIVEDYDDLKLHMDDLKKQISSIVAKDKAIENFEKKDLFDVRVDQLPVSKQYCYQDPAPVDCKTAAKCSQKSGYYKISLPGNKAKQIMVYCDTKTNGGNWLHILRRQNGSETFSRPWSDYVNGFGSVDGEYWIGLENLHALTNHNGRQHLYVYMENFEGQSYFALYDNFVVGNADEMYALKSLGKHYGPGDDDMSYNVGSKFSTIDKDNDSWPTGSCAVERQSGWWYTYCTYVQPTGQYFYNKTSGLGIVWKSFGGLGYSHKVMYLMIRN